MSSSLRLFHQCSGCLMRFYFIFEGVNAAGGGFQAMTYATILHTDDESTGKYAEGKAADNQQGF